MKAIVYEEYGKPDVLQLQEVDRPVPRENEVLVKVHAASANALDWHFLTGSPFLARIMAGGLLKPKQQILGVDLAGRVEAVGASVTRFQPGDEVFGGSGSGGAFAEHACAAEADLQRKPANVTFEEAAAAGAAAHTALQGLRDGGQIQAGQNVLINGASGGVGTFADADNFDTPILDPAPEVRLLRDASHASLVEPPVVSGELENDDGQTDSTDVGDDR